MLLCPLENTAVLKQNWIQVRPIVTQNFGENPQIYKQFGLKGHNGIDFRAAMRTPIYAPCDGVIRHKEETGGYGKYIKLRNNDRGREIVLAHFDSILVEQGQQVNMGQFLGFSGNTGFSTGPHLHMGLRFLKKKGDDVWDWSVMEYNNGYFGYIDFLKALVTFKGGLTSTSLSE